MGTIETIALPGSSPSSPTSSLVCVSLRNRGNLKCIHTYFGVVDFQLAKPCVNHVLDPIEGQGSLCNVGGNNALSEFRTLEDPGLIFGPKLGVNWEDSHFWSVLKSLQFLFDEEAGALDILLPSHEDQDIARRLLQMDCHCFLDSYINVIVNGSLFKVFVDREDPAGNLEDGCPSEEK